MVPIRITVLDNQTQRSEIHEFRSSPIRIGRHPDNDLVLGFPFISAWHAEVRNDDRGARLCDLGSSNGLVVDGEQLESGDIRPITDRVMAKVGHLELLIESCLPILEDPHARDRASVHGSVDTDAEVKAESGTQAIPIHRLHAAVRRLRPLFEQVTQARRAFDVAFATEIDELTVTRDDEMIALLNEEFSPSLRESGEPVRLGEITRITADLAPGIAALTNLDEARLFIGDMVRALQGFARGVTDLQAARERQSVEIGVKIASSDNPLFAVCTESDIIKFVLDRRKAPEERQAALQGVFSSIMAHQRGLANGAVKGYRFVTEHLAPSNIERGVQAMWPARKGALWARFEEMYETLVASDMSTSVRESLADAYSLEMARAGITVRREHGEKP